MQSRRVFLKNGAFAFVSLGFAPSFLARTAYASDAAPRAKRLIAIFQRGAVDGLSVVVPFGDGEYYRARPGIAVQAPRSGDDGAIDLDGFFGFNPRLAPLAPLWKARQLAIVHACGSPESTRSHFDAQDYMETATPGVKRTSDGWLNRYLQTRRDEHATPFRAVALTHQMPRALQGPASAVAVSDLAHFGIRAGRGGADAGASFEAAYAAARDRVLNGTAPEAVDAVRMPQAADRARYQPAGAAPHPPSPFGQAARRLAPPAQAGGGPAVRL